MKREDVLRMAATSNIALYGLGLPKEKFISHLEIFAKLVAEHEREACAKVCEELKITGLQLDAYSCNDARYKCAEAIRARGQA